LITGDIVQHGWKKQFKRANSALKAFIENIRFVPGNHDYGFIGAGFSKESAEYFDNSFSPSLGIRHPFRLKKPYVEILKDKDGNKVLIIGLNSCSMTPEPWDIAKGEIGEKQRNLLDEILKNPEYEGIPKILYLHHIPHRRAVGFGMSLKDYKELMAIVRDRVDVLAFGHEGSMKDTDAKKAKLPLLAPRPMKLRRGTHQGIKYYLDANTSVEEQSCYHIKIHGTEVSAKLIRYIYPSQKAEMLRRAAPPPEEQVRKFREVEVKKRRKWSMMEEKLEEREVKKEIDMLGDRGRTYRRYKERKLMRPQLKSPYEKIVIPTKRRCLQCRIIEPGKETEKYDEKYLKPESDYNLAFRIGLPDRRYINANRYFREDILGEYPPETTPEGEKGHTLRLILYETFRETSPQLTELFFPEKRNSKEAYFDIKIPSNKSLYQARIVVMYRNRTLQTAIFSAPIREDGIESTSRFELRVEAAVTNDLKDVDKRPNYDACLIFNHNEQGEVELVGVTDQGAKRLRLDGSSNFVQSLNSQIKSYTTASVAPSFRDKETFDLLYNLAQPGNSLYNQAKETIKERLDQIAPKKEGYNTPERIQVIEAPSGSYFPVEFFYSRFAPRTNSNMCPNAEEGLSSGTCSGQCPTDKKEIEILCPFAFWGLSVDIHRHKSDEARDLLPDECLIDFNIKPAEAAIKPFKKVLFAATKKVDEVTSGSIEKIRTLIRGNAVEFDFAETWKDWETKVYNMKPDSLVLVVHTFIESLGPAMEIGEKNSFLQSWIEEPFLKDPKTNIKPMILLIGCSTAFSAIPFQAFIPRLLSRGASVILATVTSISGSLVPSFMEVLISELKRSCVSGGSFGQAVLRTRQKALAKGQPLAVVLASYGDADLFL
jgi:hypothetical protein